MLTSLHVRNLAVVAEASLSPQPGMTAITGETGAGKSLLVDALMFLSGTRADAGMVRQGSKRAEMNALFTLHPNHPAFAWLQEQAMDDDDQCQLRRVLMADGGSKAFINGNPTTLSQLNELAAFLIDIQGQHEHQRLIDRSQQMRLLDRFANHQPMLDAMQNAHAEWLRLHQRLLALEQGQHLADRLALLKHQWQEVREVAQPAEAVAELFTAHQKHAHLDTITQACAAAIDALDGDNHHAITTVLPRITAQLKDASKHAPSLNDACQALDDAQQALLDATRTIETVAEDLEADPEEATRMAQQLADMNRVARKHHIDIDALANLRDKLAQEIDDIEQAGSDAESVRRALNQAAQVWTKHAATLTKSRQQAAETLNQHISQAMQTLGMGGGRFEAVLEATDGIPHHDGGERCEFMVAPGKGQTLSPLRKSASGGELSRLGLAISLAGFHRELPSTMVFDEVDAGIGGATADAVGQMLRELGQSCQVLCVTHLHQVAAQAHHQFKVQKISDDDAARTELLPLSQDTRVEELARMMGGQTITDAIREAAKNALLSAATDSSASK